MSRCFSLFTALILIGCVNATAQRSIVVSGSIYETGNKSALYGHPIILALDQSLAGQTAGLYSLTYSNTFGEYCFIIPDIPYTSFPFAAKLYVYDGYLNQQSVNLWFTLSDTVESPIKFYITPPDSASVLLDFEQNCDSLNAPTYIHFSNNDLPPFQNLFIQSSWKLNSNPWNAVSGFSHFFSTVGVNTLQYRIILKDSLSGFNIDTLSTSRQIAFPNSLFHTLGGNVLVNSIPIDQGIAVLYRRYDTVLEAVDTMMIDTLGYYFFPSVPQCQYTVRVTPQIEDPYNVFLPTYLGNSVYWENADHRLLQQDIFNANISLIAGQNFYPGIGSITATLTPAPDICLSLLLFNQFQQAVTYTTMTPNGYAWFQNIPFGTWYIGFEEYGFPSTLTEVNISDTSPNAFIQLESASALNELSLISAKLWPNPAETAINISASETDLSWTIFDYNGKLIKTGASVSNIFSIGLNDFPAGLYILNINSEKGDVSIPFAHQ